MIRDEARELLFEHMQNIRDRGETSYAEYFDCGELGLAYVYWAARTWWCRWFEPKVAPWIEGAS